MTITHTLSIVYQGCEALRKCSWLGSRVRKGLRLKDADVWGLNKSVDDEQNAILQQAAAFLDVSSQRHKHITGIQTSLFCTTNSTIRLVTERLSPGERDNDTIHDKIYKDF
jgi:hypothetical protein